MSLEERTKIPRLQIIPKPRLMDFGPEKMFRHPDDCSALVVRYGRKHVADRAGAADWVGERMGTFR